MFWNLNDGFRIWVEIAKLVVPGNAVIPAGLYQTVLASSATAAPPANALPVPLPFWVAIPKPPA